MPKCYSKSQNAKSQVGWQPPERRTENECDCDSSSVSLHLNSAKYKLYRHIQLIYQIMYSWTSDCFIRSFSCWCHKTIWKDGSIQSRSFVRNFMTSRQFILFGAGLYFVFTLYRFNEKFTCRNGQPSIHIFDMEHNGWHNLILPERTASSSRNNNRRRSSSS